MDMVLVSRIPYASTLWGNPAIAYNWQGVHSGPSSLRYAYFDGTTWNIEFFTTKNKLQ